MIEFHNDLNQYYNYGQTNVSSTDREREGRTQNY